MQRRVIPVFVLSLSLPNLLIAPSSVALTEDTEPWNYLRLHPYYELKPVKPKIESMQIQTTINNRYATTLVTSKIRNLENASAETTFSAILPENAFVSNFVMEIGGKNYEALIKEKKEETRINEQAPSRFFGYGPPELSIRDTKKIKLSVNVEVNATVIFRLTYEELLQRQNGQYELSLNIFPGQIVEDLSIQVNINENQPLAFVRTPSLRNGNEVGKNEKKLNPSADISKTTPTTTSARVKFNPDQAQQKHFAGLLGTKGEDGLAAQFVVQYDVERDSQGGEILVHDGYFVQFYSPAELEPLPKHVVFVLDNSGSLLGRKFDHLVKGTQKIVSELNENDLFSMVRFSTEASVWNATYNDFGLVHLIAPVSGRLEPVLRTLDLPEPVQATKENIEKVKTALQVDWDMDRTNMIVGLEVGLYLIKTTRDKFPDSYKPIIIFLTDGLPNEGVTSTDKIVEMVTKLNSGEKRTSIYSLSLGNRANEQFLQKLSSENLGFSDYIHDGDADLQILNFFRKISSPLLTNVNFKYDQQVSEVTKTQFPSFFSGSELVVAGKTSDSSNISLYVDAISKKGPTKFTPVKKEASSSLQRLWAYLTLNQILEKRETAQNKIELTKKAFDLASEYSFLTSVSSLDVVKPNGSETIENKDDKPYSARDLVHDDFQTKGSVTRRTIYAFPDDDNPLGLQRPVLFGPYPTVAPGNQIIYKN